MTAHGNEEERIEGLLAHFGAQAATPLLSFLDEGGDPVSLRCLAQWTREAFLITSVLPAPGSLSRAVSASLLWHQHDEQLADQRSMMLPGILEPTTQAAGTVFRLTGRPVLMGLEPVDVDALFRSFDRASDAYLARRSQEPPHVDWEAFEKLIAEVREETRRR
ncbi:hypothetical protein [Streptomyces sp. NPDC048436]|uniref:hypothetical protein n=1 Tax=Streptomyces sp. NPDC048436 TaxID=3365550 RepID=UPI00371CBD6B